MIDQINAHFEQSWVWGWVLVVLMIQAVMRLSAIRDEQKEQTRLLRALAELEMERERNGKNRYAA